MLSKKVVKDIQSLALKKHRDETGLFIAEGPKIVEELVKTAPQNVVAVYATEEWSKGKTFKNGETISLIELEKISGLKTPNEVVAVMKQFETTVPDSTSFTLYLDTVQDPGNFGTIVRIADWFGVKDIVCTKGCADLYNPKVVQSTMASMARVNVYYDEEDRWLNAQTEKVYAASLHGKSLTGFDKCNTGILIIGNESKGIRTEYLERASELITIPKRGGAESLNAAVATGIILSHLLA
ncbi:MAG TPA: RNA methyltransferase [Flavisolibacter sp.]|jgi:TrmH family RNA methyltransferase|nr:RNA methyltransferase [Flavisolibacter sp.]